MTTTTEMLNEKVYWLDAEGTMVKIAATQPFNTSGSRRFDWKKLNTGLCVTTYAMHPDNADEALAKLHGYRRGTDEERRAFRLLSQELKARKEAMKGQPAATMRQMDYLFTLGVEVPAGRQLTISEASAIIDAAKSGEGIGAFGLFFADGSN